MTIKNRFPDVAPVLNLDFANSKRLDPRITFTRASTGTYVDEFGIIRTAAANQARFDHDSAGNSLGLLIEEARTNNTNNSEAFTNTGGGTGGWTANATTAPDGNSTADLWIPVSGFVNRNAAELSNRVNGTNSVFTASIFVKKKELRYAHIALLSSATYYTRLFDLDTGEFIKEYKFGSPTQTSSTVTPLTNGWYRISVSKYVSNTETLARLEVGSTDVSNPSHPYGQVTYVADGTSGMYFWGAQLEAGAFPTSYIPTTSSTATRSADVASMTGTNFSSWYNPGTGTLASQTRLLAGSRSSITYVFATRPAGSTGINVYYPNEYTLTGALKDVGASYSSASGAGFNKGAFAMDLSGSAGYINGAAGSQGSITVQTTPCSEALIGAGGVPNSTMSGHISRLAYYDRRLTDAQLQALTL